MNVGSALAEAVAPLLAGYVIQKTGDWNLPFVGSIGLLLFGAIFAYWMKPNERLAGAEMNDEFKLDISQEHKLEKKKI
jgi:cyanate permease